MYVLNGTTTSQVVSFPGGSGVLVWDASSSGTGTLSLNRKSATDANSSYTPVGAAGIGAGVAQLTGAGTLVFTECECLLQLIVSNLSGGASIRCDLQRAHAGRVKQD